MHITGPLSPRDPLVPGAAPQPSRRARLVLGIAALLAVVVAAAVVTRPSLAQSKSTQSLPTGIAIASGYQLEQYANHLHTPSAAVFDGQDLLVAEAGVDSIPRVLRLKPNGIVSVVVGSGLRAPITGLLLRNRQLYISHRGKVSVVTGDGKLKDVITGLPSDGEHPNNGIAFGPDGKIYLAQGTVTNAGIVSLDDFTLGWLDRHPDLHDIPCQDVVTLGQNYQTNNPWYPDLHQTVVTGAFQQFGSPGIPDQIVKGDRRCSGSILRFNPDGSELEMFAWGLGNPVGLTFDRNGQLWATNRGVAARGSRVISNDPDYLVRVEQGAWYGWPDYFDGQPVTATRFKTPGKPEPGFLLDPDPRLSRAFLTLAPKSGIGGLGFSAGGVFGFDDDLLLAAGSTLGGTLRIARVDTGTRQVSNVIGSQPDTVPDGAVDVPATASSLLFGPDESLYIIDSGQATGTSSSEGATGAIWRMYSAQQQALRPGGPLTVQVQDTDLGEQGAIDLGALVAYANGAAPIFGTIVGVVLVLLMGTWLLRKVRAR